MDEIPERAAPAICWLVADDCDRNYHRRRLPAFWRHLDGPDNRPGDLDSYPRMATHIAGDLRSRRNWFFPRPQP